MDGGWLSGRGYSAIWAVDVRVERWHAPHTRAPPACRSAALLPLAAVERPFGVQLRTAHSAPRADVAAFRRRVAVEQQAAAEGDNRPFVIKYWYIFLPITLVLMFGGGAAPDDEQASGNSGGGGPQASS